MPTSSPSFQYPAVIVAIALALAALFLAGCTGGNDSAVAPGAGLSDRAQAGQDVFNARCALCHGAAAAGTTLGPPLAHRIYEPGHHPDFAFRNAVQNGVAAHHWQFGNMPPVPGVSDADIEAIICYVRELQRADGIIAESWC